MSKKKSAIPFTVAARTARLIGRENVANAEGAVIELVKNAYDADAKRCVVIIDNKNSIVRPVITQAQHDTLVELMGADFVSAHYAFHSDGIYKIKETEIDLDLMRRRLSHLTSIYVIDDGDGMDDATITSNWMTIGTSNKNDKAFTHDGRVKSGAKGIGRFALDRLGTSVTLTTSPRHKPSERLQWSVDWSIFEKPGTTIGELYADLVSVEGEERYWDYVLGVLNKIPRSAETLHAWNPASGVCLKISGARDHWDYSSIASLHESLRILIPPKEAETFQIYIYCTAEPDEFGAVAHSVCDDFDYRLSAIIGPEVVDVTIERREYDWEVFPDAVFDESTLKSWPFNKETFRKGFYTRQYKTAGLIPGIDADETLKNIGTFDITIYFLKIEANKKDSKRFFYRPFDDRERRSWLSNFSGVKIYRDGFRVRPYGETNGSAYDWLDLGGRKASSPAGVSRAKQWRVSAANLSGAVNISRVHNPGLADKSSREGIVENPEFAIFKKLILAVIKTFEDDRSQIAAALDTYAKRTQPSWFVHERADQIARKVLEKSGAANKAQSETETLASAYQLTKDELDELRLEQKMIRSLASTGIVIASFTHEFRQLDKTLVRRIVQLETMLRAKVGDETFSDVPEEFHPFKHIEWVKKDDEKLKQWIGFSLLSLRKDKRTRQSIFLDSYFESFKKMWLLPLAERHIDLSIKTTCSEPPIVKAFEIDLDSIFNNLLVNSMDAFLRPDAGDVREVALAIHQEQDGIVIDYTDSGPGLSPDIQDKNAIFDAFFTTKRDRFTGKEIGTGIGLWLVKVIINEYKGKFDIIDNVKGFGLRITLPRQKVT